MKTPANNTVITIKRSYCWRSASTGRRASRRRARSWRQQAEGGAGGQPPAESQTLCAHPVPLSTAEPDGTRAPLPTSSLLGCRASQGPHGFLAASPPAFRAQGSGTRAFTLSWVVGFRAVGLLVCFPLFGYKIRILLISGRGGPKSLNAW